MKLEKVIPWGRSFDEYCRIFKLGDRELNQRILGCADGPASFNAELSSRKGRVVSCDPVYQFSAGEIAQRIQEVYPTVLAELAQNSESYHWEDFKSPDDLGKSRMATMNTFLEDYDQGVTEGRYIGAALPFLPFESNQFELALCSHYLFLYSEHLDENAHLRAVNELCRVAEEVRIYPTVDLNGQTSAHLEPVMGAMQNYGIACHLESVTYRFQKNASSMLVLRKTP